MMDKINKLRILYKQSSKHSNYQVLSKNLSSLIGDDINIKSRHEWERLDFILKNVHIKDNHIIDIGGNTGFFSFELIEAGAKHVDFYEGNETHAAFVDLASEVLCVKEKIHIINKYQNFEDELNRKKYDIALLLNVLHHVGDDYGDKNLTIEMAKIKILQQLNSLADKVSIAIFQLGFNWKGNKNHCLFENGTKKELITFVDRGISNHWEILKIGVAESENGKIAYNILTRNNIKRNDSLGEFLNRPIWILKSKKWGELTSNRLNVLSHIAGPR